jgi:adenylate cyclase
MGDAFLIPELAPLNRHRLGALTSLGRHPENTLEIPDRSVSKFHAQIQRTPEGGFVLQDLGSRNGTYVAGQRIDRSRLNDGDELVLGTVRFRFHAERVQAGLTAAIRVPDFLKSTGGLTVIGPARSGSAGTAKVALHQGEAAIEHSNTYDFSQDRFLPGERISDVDALRRDYDKLRIAHELNSQLRLGASIDELLKAIATRSFELIPADRVVILLMQPDGATLEPRVVLERGGGEPKDAVPLSQTVLNEVLRNKKAVLSTDAITDGRFQAAASIVALSMRSAMCVPLIYEEDIFGAIQVDCVERASAFTPKDLQIFTSIANQAASALKNASLIQQIQQETETRARLGRLLSPDLVDAVVRGELDMASGGERREAAVLFADIRGFTPMSARMDAQDVTTMLNEYFEVMVDVLFQNAGTLDKYLGDGIMALFGVPKADAQAPINAVRCAVQMQIALRSLNRVRQARGETPISIGIGINRGEVIWGPLGSRKTMDYTVVGDVVNTASRLCSIAPPGEVIISQAVRDGLGDTMLLEQLPPATVKGKTEPIQVYRVVGDKSAGGSGSLSAAD